MAHVCFVQIHVHRWSGEEVARVLEDDCVIAVHFCSHTGDLLVCTLVCDPDGHKKFELKVR